MAKITYEINDTLLCKITDKLRKEINSTARCINVKVIKTKSIVKAVYLLYDSWKTKQTIDYTFQDIKGIAGIDLDKELKAIEVKSKSFRKELVNKQTSNYITIKSDDKEEEYMTREAAEKYYLEKIQEAEGTDRQRYMSIYLQLVQGDKSCAES